MAKEYNTKDELSVPRSAAGAALRAARQGFVYDKFGIKTKFKAQVLSRPISVTGRDFGQSTNTNNHIKFMYKARILGNPSPHDYLPDPCDASLAIDQNKALKLIGYHTTFISNIDFGAGPQEPPKIGDVVRVRLEPGRFSYNLQTGVHLNVVDLNFATVTEPSTGENDPAVLCETLTDLFGEGSVPTQLFRNQRRVVLTDDGTGTSTSPEPDTSSRPARVDIDYGPGSHAPRNLEKFDEEYNLWRSKQPTPQELAWIIDTYNITHVVRMNSTESCSSRYPTMTQEKAICDEKGVSYNTSAELPIREPPNCDGTGDSGVGYIDGHSGFTAGQGYTRTKQRVFEILNRRNVLVHCSAGKDRTGYIVAAWIKQRAGTAPAGNFPESVGDNPSLETLWQYTISFNGWGGSGGYVCKGGRGGNEGTNLGYARYLDGFYPLNQWCASTTGANPSNRSNCWICRNLDRFGYST